MRAKEINKDEAAQLRSRFTEALLSTPTRLDVDKIKARNWIALPVEEHLIGDEIPRLAQAATNLGVSWGTAVVTEPQLKPTAYQVKLDEEGFLYFDNRCMLRVFLLVGLHEEFCILNQADYYHIIAGPRKFVEQAVGQVPAEAWKLFYSYADDPEGWSEEIRKWLVEIADEYRPEVWR